MLRYGEEMDVADQLEEAPAAPMDVFENADHGDARPGPAGLELNGHGYRWSRLHQAVAST